VGRSHWSASARLRGFVGKRMSGSNHGDMDTITEEEQSFGGRSPRALGVERHFLGMGELKTVERVAKP